jgi:DNA-binding CsgD family transcriptional regulator
MNGLDIISEDGYALMGLVAQLDKRIHLGGSAAPCLLLLTYATLIEMHVFLERYANAFINHDLVIIIGPFSAKKLIEGLTETAVAFINISNEPTFISDEISRVLNEPPRQGAQHEPLTHCEQRTLALLLKGYSGPLMTKLIGVNEKTISSQRRSAMKKYGVSSMMLLAMKYSLDMTLCNTLAAIPY